MKISELYAHLKLVDSQLIKARDEIVAKVTALETALSDTEITEEAQDALDSLQAAALAIDDIVPDTEE